MKKEKNIDRRAFLRDIGLLGAGAVLSVMPGFAPSASGASSSKGRCRLGVIGVGSRGCFHLSLLNNIPDADVVAICDTYRPSIDEALKLVPHAKVYTDYHRLLDDRDVDAVIIATPLTQHCQIACDAFDAGKDVLCEKCLGYTMDETYRIYQAYRHSGRIFFSGQQRLFDPRYQKVMEMIHAGTFGKVGAVKTFWYRNGDWRRHVPEPSLERQINWRLYGDTSRGLMTELGCHQLQVGMWALRKIPDKVMGHGAITYWKDGREVPDNVSCIYVFDDGVKMTFDSVISNKFYGLEEQILCSEGTVEPEKGKYYFEELPPAPAFLRLLNDWENRAFDSMPFAGTSWAPETAQSNSGTYITGNRPKGDGTSEMLEAFVDSVITRCQPANVAEEGYYASQLCLMGDLAIREDRTVWFPDEYKLDYLNHKAPAGDTANE